MSGVLTSCFIREEVRPSVAVRLRPRTTGVSEGVETADESVILSTDKSTRARDDGHLTGSYTTAVTWTAVFIYSCIAMAASTREVQQNPLKFV